ncbi:MAG: hypothetical protein J5669_08095 [Bacteroidales bacterium]|nr:hypothetical protein [Bacteroidales bacterium]
MKKILEVLQDKNGEMHFHTDIDIDKNPSQISDVASMALISMATRLWGGNECSVLSVLRALTMADFALCVRRKELIQELEMNANALINCFQEAQRTFEEAGGTVLLFPPHIMPPKMSS